MKEKTICPLLTIAGQQPCPCHADGCAWWVRGLNGGGRCAIQVLGAEKVVNL